MTAYVEHYRGLLPLRMLLVGGLLVVLPWGEWDGLTEPSRSAPAVPGGPPPGPDVMDRVLAALSIPAVALGVLLVVGAVVQTVWTLRRRVALAADEQGLYLGPGLFPPARPVRLPWTQVGLVRLRRMHGGPGRAGTSTGPSWNRLVVLAPDGRTRLASRVVDGWRYDPGRFAQVVHRSAPAVRVER